MINANEAHKIMEKNNTRNTELKAIVDSTLPFFEQRIRHIAKLGGNQTIVARDEIMAKVDHNFFFTKKEILTVIVEELKGFGFKAAIPASYTSIHIEW